MRLAASPVFHLTCRVAHLKSNKSIQNSGRSHHLLERAAPSPSYSTKPQSAAAAAPATQAAAKEDEDGQSLSDFLAWLLANGAEGVGAPESKAALYEGENGERGLVAVAPLARGDTVLKVPLRLAVTDHQDDEESNALVYKGAPWSVRLAAKVLRLQAQGAACPWHPYIKVLPGTVPSPLTLFSWEDIQAVGYEPLRRELDSAAWLAASAADTLDAAATGGATSAQLDWALSVVHSRTFANMAQSGGAVRMLVPGVDMLNHAGDVATAAPGSPDPAAVAADNVRWDVISRIGGEFVMVVTATRDVEAGEELLLSYGERSNDDFFLYYGVVPPRNPHDDVALFASIEDAIDWHLERYIRTATLSPGQLQAAIAAAYAAAAALDAAGSAEASLKGLVGGEAGKIRAELSRMKLSSGCRVDGRLVAAVESLHGAARVVGGAAAPNCQAHVREAIAARAAEVLQSMHKACGATLLADLEALAGWEAGNGRDPDHGFAEALAYYTRAIDSSGKRGAVEGALKGVAGSTSGGGAALIDAGGMPGDETLLALLQQEGSSRREVEYASPTAHNSAAEPSILPVAYRAYKMMICWDAVLAAE